MGYTYLRKVIFYSSVLLSLQSGICQPFVDIINTSYQSLQTKYSDTLLGKNKTDNVFLNITVPIKIDSQNTVIVRFYGERLFSQSIDYSPSQYSPLTFSVLNSTLLPIGLQHETKSKKWKFIGLAMPKFSGQFNPISKQEFQMGGYAMATWVKSDKFKVKFGLFYNREFFGDFFIPVFAIDWKVSSRFQMYGTLPNFYRFEYAVIPKFLYAGIGFKSYTRTYHLYINDPYYSGDFYVRNNEIQVKAFVDLYLNKRFVFYGEFGRTINYSPKMYLTGTKDLATYPGVYSPIKDAFFFNVGIAYRIRFDF